MKTYIALIRGINIGGHHKIKMQDLKILFEKLGFKNVTTYIQSGNIVFNSEENNTNKLEELIINTINNNYGYNIKTLVLTRNELETIFKSNPFIENQDFDIKKMYATILKDKPILEKINEIEELASVNNDSFKIVGKTIYVYSPNGYGKTKLTTNLFESKLKTFATSRNWRTLTKLIELSNQ